MIPDNPNLYVIDSDNRLLVAPFQYPDNIASNSELVDYEYGGIELQNPDRGLQYQIWKGYWKEDDETAYLEAEFDPTPISLFTQSGVVEFAFTFDQNMRWSSAVRLSDNTLEHRWYDAAAEAYVVTSYSNVTSVRLTLDDKRSTQIQSGMPDMILTYVRSNQVRWRIQRDRFLTEYTHSGFTVPDGIRITHFGMSKINRLQWRLGPRRVN